MKPPIERNKDTALAFYDMMFNKGQPTEAVRQFVGDVYVQHNPIIGNGKKAFIDYFERMADEHPAKKVEIRRVIAEGNYVVLHCHQEFPGENAVAGMDIFRFDENGKICEHWSVLQESPKKSANNNSMF